MIFSRYAYWRSLVLLGLLTGCAATRPINPPITQVDTSKGYRYLVRQPRGADQDNLVILAFSGGGTRAAAFSYGVLETLNRTEVVGPKGNKIRLIDQFDLITGVSGGNFTALAYGLYGDKLFDEYEKRFLKRNVQGELRCACSTKGHLSIMCAGLSSSSSILCPRPRPIGTNRNGRRTIW